MKRIARLHLSFVEVEYVGVLVLKPDRSWRPRDGPGTANLPKNHRHHSKISLKPQFTLSFTFF